MDELPDYVWKIFSASQHYETINELVAEHIRVGLQTSETVEVENGKTWHVFRWDNVEQPTPRLGLVLGDFIHNIRSALDYVAVALAADNGAENIERIQFPICDSTATWRDNIEQRKPERGPSPVDGIPHDKIALIEKAQPYHAPRAHRAGHPLLQLLRLSNTDKHRELHVGTVNAAAPDIIDYEPSGFYKASRRKFARQGTLVENGAEIVRLQRIVIAEPPPGTEVQMHFSGRAEVVFGPAGKPPIATHTDLAAIHEYAKKLAYRLRPWDAGPAASDLSQFDL